jgi:Family of unknown function (DUF5989)
MEDVMSDNSSSRFEKVASQHQGGNVVGEFWFFLRQTNKWWLVPIVLILVLFGAFMLLSTTAAAPFIYTLF